MGEVRFMISEAAKQIHVESHVLRYWEDELGLVIGRTEMGHRYYTPDDIKLFCCIKKLKDEGLLLKDLKPLIPELTQTKHRLQGSLTQQYDTAAQQQNAPACPDPSINSARATSAATQHRSLTQYSAQTQQHDTAAQQQNAPACPDPSLNSAQVSSAATQHRAMTQDMPSAPEVVIPLRQLDQVRTLISDVVSETVSEAVTGALSETLSETVSEVITENNHTLKEEIASAVTSDVMREMDFLMQARERQEEEHFRRLDTLIRQQQANRKESSKSSAAMRLKNLFT